MKNLKKVSTKANATFNKFVKNELSKAASKAVKGGTGDGQEKVDFVVVEDQEGM